MSNELQALLSLVLDLVKIGEEAFEKVPLPSLISQAVSVLLSDIPAIIANFPGLMGELHDLSDKNKQAHVIAFIQGKVKDAGSDKAQAILSAIVEILKAAYALEQAIVG